jgi:hypothetical protein
MRPIGGPRQLTKTRSESRLQPASSAPGQRQQLQKQLQVVRNSANSKRQLQLTALRLGKLEAKKVQEQIRLQRAVLKIQC